MRRPFLFLLTGLALSAAVPGHAATSHAAYERSVAATKAAMMTDPQAALLEAGKASRLAESLPEDRYGIVARATAQWLTAEALMYVNAPDRARPIIDKALAAVIRVAPDTKLHGDLLRSRGATSAISGRVQEALTDFQAAYEVFVRAGELRSQAIALQDIGEIYLDAGDYQRVLQYYAQSAETFRADPFLLLTTHNNRAQVLRELKRYDAAVAEYRLALADARKVGSPLLEVRILTNLAAAQVDAGRTNEAERSVTRAMTLARAGEAHGWLPFVLGMSAKVKAARNDYASAAALLDRLFAGADPATATMPYRELHDLASRVYERQGRDAEALDHLKTFRRLDGEARALTASTKAQLMAARFDFANQNLKISRLKQGQLTRDIQIERQRSRLRTVILGGLLAAGVIVLSLLLFGYVSIRRSRNEVRAANDSLTQTNAALEKALAAKTEFLAMTSHEIRTPLNGILGMTQVMLSRSAIDAQTRGQVEVVHSAGEAMKALVDDILDAAKMERGNLVLERRETDLPVLVAGLADLWRAQAALKGLTLSVDLDPAATRIMSDPARLRQALSNLLSNAVKFTRAGSVALTSQVVGDTLLLTIADTGIGIPADKHGVIFDAFAQVDAGVTREYGGTGLGLAITREIVVAMGGTITVESQVGGGTTFRVVLPLEHAPAAEMIGTHAFPALAEARVMLVDNNLLRQSIVRAAIEPAAGSFCVAWDAHGALQAIKAGTVDHVVIDAAICAGDAAAIHQLAAAATAAGARMIVLHTPGDAPDMADLHRTSALLLAKPLSASALLDALRDQPRDQAA